MRNLWRISLTLAVGAVIAAACGDLKDGVVQPIVSDEPLTYTADIRPILQLNCVSCHAGGSAEGQYDLTTIVGVVGEGTDSTPNALPGNSGSVLLQVLASGDHAGYAGGSGNVEALRKWVVVDSMNLQQPNVHPVGWTDPASDGFHGRSIKADGWDLAGCRSCHGDDYSGGVANASCLTCHTETPEDCSTCHGTGVSAAPPMNVDGEFAPTAAGVGAHTVHLAGSSLFTGIACEDCHTVPQSVEAPGHVDSDLPAEVSLRGIAAHGGNVPVWDGTSCGNTYCHGNVTPAWTNVGAGVAACGTCHGLPPNTPQHPQVSACDACHGQVVNADGQIIDASLHINGSIDVQFGHPEGFVSPASDNFHGLALRKASWNLADCQACHGPDYLGTDIAPTCATCHPQGPDDCSVCHGSFSSAAPPRDIDNNSSPTFSGVGAHQAHLSASSVARAMACSECHLVPEKWSDPKHVDSDLPAEVVFGTLATTDGLSPVYDGTTCGNTYCHGDATVTWTSVGTGEAACGTCHGAPPPSPHPPLSDCAICHSGVAGPNQTIIDTNRHMNGTVDFQ